MKTERYTVELFQLLWSVQKKQDSRKKIKYHWLLLRCKNNSLLNTQHSEKK